MNAAVKYIDWNIDYLKQVYFFQGSCIWQFQLFEDTLSKFIVLALKLDSDEAKKEAIQILEKQKKTTLGQLIADLKKRGNVPSDLDEQMESFLLDRNWVVHHSYADFLRVAHVRVECDRLLTRLARIDFEAHRLTHVFWDAVDVLASDRETQDNEIRAIAQQVRQAWTEKNGGCDG